MKNKKFKTKYFTLRKVEMRDAPELYKLQQDKEIKKNFMSIPKNISEVKKHILQIKKSKKQRHFVIEINNKVAGEIEISDVVPHHKAKLIYWLAKQYRGKGIMTKVVTIFTEHVFREYKIKRIYSYVRTFNKPSARVLEKVGYKSEGILKKNKLKNGKYLDDMLWAKVK